MSTFMSIEVPNAALRARQKRNGKKVVQF